jgi:hypothetical protein
LLSCRRASIPARDRIVRRFVRDALTRGSGRACAWPAETRYRRVLTVILTWHWRPAVLAASEAVEHAVVDRLVFLGGLVALGT